MRILAIDTSSAALGAAIADETGLVSEFNLHSGRQHSEALLSMVEALLTACRLQLADLDAFAVTVGPGSFTGLRIGLATVKAWVQALEKPLCAISTLEALALTAAERDTLVCPILNARRNEFYTALFRNGTRLTADSAVAPAALAEQLRAYEQPIVFAGDGLVEDADILRQALGERMIIAPEPRRLFLSAQAALLGRRDYLAGRFVEAATLTPYYLRLSEPEEKMLAQQGETDEPAS